MDPDHEDVVAAPPMDVAPNLNNRYPPGSSPVSEQTDFTIVKERDEYVFLNIPYSIHEDDNLDEIDRLAFIPWIGREPVTGEPKVYWELVEGVGELQNERFVRTNRTAQVRLPQAIARERGYFDLARRDEDQPPAVEISRLGERHYRFHVTAAPDTPAARRGAVDDPTDRLIPPTSESGFDDEIKLDRYLRHAQQSEKDYQYTERYPQLRLDIPYRFLDPNTLALKEGDRFVSRVTYRDGQMALALERESSADASQAGVHEVWMKDVEVDGKEYDDRANIYIPRYWAHALGFVTTDGRAPLHLSAENDRLLLERVGSPVEDEGVFAWRSIHAGQGLRASDEVRWVKTSPNGNWIKMDGDDIIDHDVSTEDVPKVRTSE